MMISSPTQALGEMLTVLEVILPEDQPEAMLAAMPTASKGTLPLQSRMYGFRVPPKYQRPHSLQPH